MTVSECLQLEYHRSLRHHLLLVYAREVLILDLHINQTVGIIPMDKSTSPLLQVLWGSLYTYISIYMNVWKNLCNMDMMVFALKLFTAFRVTIPCCNLVGGYQHSCITYCLLTWQKIKTLYSSEMFIHTHQITSKCVSPDNHSTCVRTGIWNCAFIIVTFSFTGVH